MVIDDIKKKNTTYFFLFPVLFPPNDMTWLTAVGCFIFGAAVLIYLSLCDISARQRAD